MIIASLLSRLLTPHGNELFQNLHKYKTDNAKVRDLSSSQTPSTPLSNTHTNTHANTHRLQPPDVCWQNCLRSLIGTFLFFSPLSHSLFLSLLLCHSLIQLCVRVCLCVHFCFGAKACVSARFHGKRIRAWVPLNETEAEATAHSVAMR